MSITMKCPGCETSFQFADELLGKRIKCKSCGEIFKISPPAITPKPTSAKATPVAKTPVPKSSPPKPGLSSKSKPVADDEEDDDRPGRSRQRDDDDGDEDDRPNRSRRRDEDDEETPKNRRKHWDDEDDDFPKAKKKGGIPLVLLIAPAVAFVLIGGLVAILVLRGGKSKDKESTEAAGVKPPLATCTVDWTEKEINQLIVTDTGNQFAVFRKPEQFGNTWEIDPVDIATGKSSGKCRIPELENPQNVAISPDGKYVVIEQNSFGNSERAVTLYSTAQKAELTKKWMFYPRKNFNGPTLFRAEFIGNDKLVTISTARGMDVWKLPNFEGVVTGIAYRSVGEPLQNSNFRFGDRSDGFKSDRLLAFSADRKQLAVWTGDGYVVAGTEDGVETARLPIAPFNFQRVQAGPVAFRPDGKVLAAIFEHGNFGSQSVVLVLWDISNPGAPVLHNLYANQFDNSKGINWWGNRYIVTTGGRVDGIIIDTQDGKVKRQLMSPAKKVFSFSRNGRLWYALSKELRDPAKIVMVDPPEEGLEKDPNQDPYEDILDNKGRFLRRLWMEPEGVLRTPTRFDPPLRQNLISQP